MLRQRVLTALVLLAILLPTLFWGAPWMFSALMLLFIAAGGWEWGRLNGLATPGAWGLGALCAAVCLGVLFAGGLNHSWLPLWGLGALFWIVWGAWILHAGVPRWATIPRSIRLVGGVMALCLAWLAMAQARQQGVHFLLSVLSLVWAADIFAYFAGRTFGLRFTRQKLAPSISPGKSWEGVWGACIGVLLLSLLWAHLEVRWGAETASFYRRLAAAGVLPMVLALAVMVALSIVGDLVESLIKRSAGVKDSSQLLPGHGGVLDRVDALLPTLPLAMFLSSWMSL